MIYTVAKKLVYGVVNQFEEVLEVNREAGRRILEYQKER
jgi:hypothetical protein